MGNFIDLTGQTFGRWCVESFAETDKNGNAMWNCVCRCKKRTKRAVRGSALRGDKSNSCGCLTVETLKKVQTTHGYYHSPYYHRWYAIKQRCYNENSENYYKYGARGIKMHDDFKNDYSMWINYVSQLPDFGKQNFTIDRIDNNGDYTYGNLKWSTPTQQCRNQRTPKNNAIGHKGVYWKKEMKKWCARITVDYKIKHLGYFDSLDEAILARKQGEKDYW